MKNFFSLKRSRLLVVIILTICLTGGVAAYAQSKATYDPDRIYAAIDKSYTGITEYADKVKTQNGRLALSDIENVITTVTFAEKLSFSEIEGFVTKYDIEPVQLQARGLMPDGTKITIFSRTDKGFEETKALLLQQAEEEGYEFIGFIGMNAMIDARNLKEVETDALTYLADTSGDRFFRASKETDGFKRNNLMEGKRGGMFPQSLAWDLEELGLQK